MLVFEEIVHKLRNMRNDLALVELAPDSWPATEYVDFPINDGQFSAGVYIEGDMNDDEIEGLAWDVYNELQDFVYFSKQDEE